MRILHLSDYGVTLGGAETSVKILNDELNHRGHLSRIFSSTAAQIENPDKEAFADYWCYGTTGRTRVLNQLWNFRAIKQLKEVLTEFEPDIVHIHMFLTQLSPLLLRVIASTPIIHTAHWFRDVCLTGFKTLPSGQSCRFDAGVACLSQGCVPLRDWMPQFGQLKLFNWYKHRIHRTIAISETVKSYLEEGGVPVDDVINSCTIKQEARCPLTDPPRIGFAARMVREKGGFVLLEAFRQLREHVPETRLDVFGDGPCLNELKKVADNIGKPNHIRFHGYLNQQDLQIELAKSWVQVAPTIVEEPLGMVAIEAAMRGTAVVASDKGGFKETVTPGETGYLTPAGDATALANALQALVSDKSLAERFGRRNRASAERRWTVDLLTDRYVKHYENLT